MKLSDQDKNLLAELCDQHKVSFNKVVKLLDTIREYEFKDRRTGVYEALKNIIQSNLIGD
jgi:glutamate mutase epsilon subunit